MDASVKTGLGGNDDWLDGAGAWPGRLGAKNVTGMRQASRLNECRYPKHVQREYAWAYRGGRIEK